MRVLHTASELDADEIGALVPTMGALHQGHLSLVRMAANSIHPVVVSIFVNPTQFSPHEDYETYPRDLDRDIELAMANGADVIYIPGIDEIYPRGIEAAHAESETIALPKVATTPGLEDASRPRFFGGVCMVVARLLNLVRPHVAYFGEKDWQQLMTIRAMVQEAERFNDITIQAGPTIREADGLAMSSRNAFLKPEQRHAALGLHTALEAIHELQDPARAEARMLEILLERGLEIDYAVVRDAQTLLAPCPGKPARALIAARLNQPGGDVRLIDNAPYSVDIQ